ncbi:unnamed protein product [Umbelopsis ramanniana]
MAMPVGDKPQMMPRTTKAATSISYDLNSESNAVAKNGPLPAGVPTKGGFSLNSTYQTGKAKTLASVVSADATFTGSSSTVSDLEFYTTLAANAYCSTVQADSWTCAHCTVVPDGKLVTTFNTPKTNNVGYILQSDSKKAIYIVFRGSNSIQNWVDDLEFTYTTYTPISGAEVHNGFYAAFQEASSLIYTSASALMTSHPTYKFYVVGHSLGGALAILEALDLYQRDKRFTASNLGLYTFGEPRVGNPTFATYASGLGLNLKRTVNQNDIVPHLPPEDFGFLHEGNEYWITDSSNDISECTSPLDSPNCSDSIVPFTSITAHLSYFGINCGSCL